MREVVRREAEGAEEEHWHVDVAQPAVWEPPLQEEDGDRQYGSDEKAPGKGVVDLPPAEYSLGANGAHDDRSCEVRVCAFNRIVRVSTVDSSFEAGTKQVLLNRVRQAEGMGSPGHENLSGWSMAQTLSMCVSCH